jgi:hypothetical protein
MSAKIGKLIAQFRGIEGTSYNDVVKELHYSKLNGFTFTLSDKRGKVTMKQEPTAALLAFLKMMDNPDYEAVSYAYEPFINALSGTVGANLPPSPVHHRDSARPILPRCWFCARGTN